MNKIIIGLAIIVATSVLDWVISNQHTLPLSKGFMPVGIVLYFVGLFIFWFGIIYRVNVLSWLKWIVAIILSIATMGGILYYELWRGL